MNHFFEEKGHGTDVIAVAGIETVHRSSLRRLRPKVWLNNELVNFQMHCMDLLHKDGIKCHCFSSYFMSKLVGDPGGCNFDNVKRWFKKINIFDYGKLIFPVNHNRCHWVAMLAQLGEN